MKHMRLLLVCSALLLSLILTVGLHATLAHRSAPNSTTEDLQEKPTDPNVHNTDTDTVSVATENGSITPPVYFSWSEGYDESDGSWVSADGTSPDEELWWMIQGGEVSSLPLLPCGETLTVTLPRNATLSRYGCYSINEAGKLDRVIGHTELTEPFFAQLNTLGSGEYFVAIHFSTQGDYIESQDRYESSGRYAVFRYEITPPPCSRISFSADSNSILLLWIGDSFIVPDPYPIWSESDGLCADFVSDVPSLIRSGELNVDKLPCLRAGENMTVSLPGNTTYKGYVIYRYVDRAYVLQRDLPNDLNQALSDLTREEWLIGLEFQTRDANSAHGWRAYFRYVVE